MIDYNSIIKGLGTPVGLTEKVYATEGTSGF